LALLALLGLDRLPMTVELTPGSSATLGGQAPVLGVLLPEHWPAVAEIYRQGIETGDATFETEVPIWKAWDAAHLGSHRFVALAGGDVVGWVAASAVSGRCAYAGVVEHSVYVAASARRQGVGLALIGQLVRSTEQAGIWTIQTGIFPENQASVRLHEQAGFKVVGRRERLGMLNGAWRDVLFLERRSKVAG
jgi:phosphinothricin acetyltransferase